ncbi:MAG: hypothetical protein ACP5P5_10490 [Hydrotalea sp.]
MSGSLLVVGAPPTTSTLHNAMYVIAIGSGFYGIVKQNSFAEAIVYLLLIFFSSLFVWIQKVTKKSRLHNQGYSGICSATTKKSKAWL